MSQQLVNIQQGGLSASDEGLRELIETIQARIADPKATRKTVADVYGFLVSLSNAQREQVPWGDINRAIMARWSISALNYIKKRAWDSLKPIAVSIPDAQREGRP